jgi:hypothetical protein
MNKDVYLIEDWKLVSCMAAVSPEEAYARIDGNVFNNPNFQEGDPVITSVIEYAEGELICTRSGSKYQLGNPLPSYEEQYPNAKERLLKARQ